MPAVTVCLFLTISNCFKAFDQILSLTGGGPFKSTETVALDIYFEAFTRNNFGLGSAKAIVFFVIVAAVTMVQVALTKRREVEAYIRQIDIRFAYCYLNYLAAAIALIILAPFYFVLAIPSNRSRRY